MQNDIHELRKEFNKKHNIAKYCANCHSIDNLQVHHIIPLSLGGTNYESNLVTLCGNCHAKIHGIKLGDDWKELQRIGIERAKKEGKFKGGKPKQINEELLKVYIDKINNHEITKTEAAKILKISRPTLNKYIDKEYIKQHSNEVIYSTN